jgi:uncharacterized protein (DUF433 family)
MNNLLQAKELIFSMSRAEKAQILQWIANELSDIFPGIEKTTAICGGKARVAGTRIPVWSIVEAQKMGYSDDRILYEYPTLRASDLVNIWNYFEARKTEIEAEIKENELA